MWDPHVWWEEMVAVTWRDGWNPLLLAKYLSVMCKLSQVQFAQAGDSYWEDPPCLSVFEHEDYMPKEGNPLLSWKSTWRLGINAHHCLEPPLGVGWVIVELHLPGAYGMISAPPTNPHVESGGLHPGWCPASPAGQASLRTDDMTGANAIIYIRIGANVAAKWLIPNTSWRR